MFPEAPCLLVGTARFELTTSRTPSERATRLRYVPCNTTTLGRHQTTCQETPDDLSISRSSTKPDATFASAARWAGEKPFSDCEVWRHWGASCEEESVGKLVSNSVGASIRSLERSRAAPGASWARAPSRCSACSFFLAPAIVNISL